MAVSADVIKKLGGPSKVAQFLGMTPNGVWRYTQPGAEVPPRRQRQILTLAAGKGVPLTFADFHADAPAAKLPTAQSKAKSVAAQATSAGDRKSPTQKRERPSRAAAKPAKGDRP